MCRKGKQLSAKRKASWLTIAIVAGVGCPAVLQFLSLLRIEQMTTGSSCWTAMNNAPTTGLRSRQRTGPFEMPRSGPRYDIFQPLYDLPGTTKLAPIVGSPADLIKTYEERISWVDPMVAVKKVRGSMTSRQHAKKMYVETIKSFVSGVAFGEAELSLIPARGKRASRNKLVAATLDRERREIGTDWTYAGDTMTGLKRLNNVRDLLEDVNSKGIEGDYIETGVWRGGSSIFAKAVLSAFEYEQPNAPQRVLYLCDSFKGLPPGERKLSKEDKDWDHTPYHDVSAEIVANNFIKYGLLDSNVVFARGFFNETMPPLGVVIKSLSVIRFDGDMYESAVDVLYNLYPKLSIGGYLIMDDWFNFPSKIAAEDFFAVHGINPEINLIDVYSAYWKKTEHVDVQYWRYQQSIFKPGSK